LKVETWEAKAMLGIMSGTEKLASLEIVWRNPNRVRACRRRHNFERTGECAMYIMQEFVEDGQTGYWATISGLELLAGGRAA
jgi:hypothetical protein